MIQRSSSTTAVVLLSGGLDSTVALADTLTRMPVACALTFDYGQRAVKQELRATQAIATHYELSHRIISLPWLAELLPAALQQAPTSKVDNSALSQEALFDVNRVWVPNRNGLFLNIAASFAEALQASHIVFGANAEEGAEFPDNTIAFRNALNKTLAYSTLNGVRVETPVGRLSKLDIIQHGLALKAPFDLVWSCYENGDKQCGQCPSCLRVKSARDMLKSVSGRTAPIVFNVDS